MAKPTTWQCTSSLCGCGRWYDDHVPGNLSPECRARVSNQREYDAERAAERAAATRAKSVESRMAELLDEAGRWDHYHQQPRAVVAAKTEQALTRYPTPRGEHF